MNPRLKKNKHGANDNDGDDDKETFGIDDSARKKRRNGPLKKDTKGMVDNQQRVPQNQESSVLITQSIGLLWRLDALRIDHPQQWLAVRQVRIPFCFARRSPVMRGGGDWSESNNNTITLSFEQETRAHHHHHHHHHYCQRSRRARRLAGGRVRSALSGSVRSHQPRSVKR
jgi:hypothetical protein